nr:MAG TPA: hypothetical protein [Caudoviricetes sp.]
MRLTSRFAVSSNEGRLLGCIYTEPKAHLNSR